MVFSSVTFLFYFLPLILLLYFGFRPVRWKNTVLLVMSLLFYMWGAGEVVLVFMASIAGNWMFGLLINRADRKQQPAVKKAWLTLAIVMNLALLGYYKYANFLVEQLDQVIFWILPQVRPFPNPGILLPIGISFFTFQALSYVIDVYRGHVGVIKNPVDMGMYLSMFPQLIAGPIVRYDEIEPQVKSRQHTWDNVASGLVRFMLGLFKKAVIADPIGMIADQAFGLDQGLGAGLAWLGLVAFTLQVYFDFSGYSDMAIGLGRVFGFHFRENFNRPYMAVSFTDFWRRWHISLSTWFRDYVYIPLGGSRVSSWKIYFNLLVVFVLMGFWHGANWTFIALGLYHGFFMCWERISGKRLPEDFRHPGLQRMIAFFLIMLGMVFFRARNLPAAADYFRGLVTIPQEPLHFYWLANISNQSLVTLGFGLLLVFWPRAESSGSYFDHADSRTAAWLRLSVAALGLVAAVLMMASSDFQPFIYFKF
ncbi:MAG: MBOAT family protein [candidate division FCPU426 bacterium]